MPRPTEQIDTEDRDSADTDAHGEKVDPVGKHYSA